MFFHMTKNLKETADARQKWLERWRDNYIKLLSEEPIYLPKPPKIAGSK